LRSAIKLSALYVPIVGDVYVLGKINRLLGDDKSQPDQQLAAAARRERPPAGP
jgi:hypothetical protein